MPNWVTTRLTANNQETLDALFRDMTEEELAEPRHAGDEVKSMLDFNLIVPQPDNIEKGHCSGVHEPNVVCWYRWNIENWGTKWGAAHVERVSPTEVRFDTAWSVAMPVLERLSAMFPQDIITVKYADEDIGQNLGELQLANGSVVCDRGLKDGSDEAREFAAQLVYGTSYAELTAEWDRQEEEEWEEENGAS